AKAEWLRQAPELHALGLLTILDLQTFAAYCQAYGRWRDAEETLATMAERDDDARGLLVRNGKGDVRTNPLVRIAGQAAEEMVRFAGEFGMTPAARSKLVAGIGRQPRGKFDGLIG